MCISRIFVNANEHFMLISPLVYCRLFHAHALLSELFARDLNGRGHWTSHSGVKLAGCLKTGREKFQLPAWASFSDKRTIDAFSLAPWSKYWIYGIFLVIFCSMAIICGKEGRSFAIHHFMTAIIRLPGIIRRKNRLRGAAN